jgi:HD-like signal output (HDOD) protein
MDYLEAKNIVFDSVKSLPTLPEIFHKVLVLVADEDASLKELSDLISYDQAISTRLLKVANSAYYGFMKKIATIQRAIVVLGFEEVKSLTLGIGLFNTMKRVKGSTSLNLHNFWLHSVGCALAGQNISQNAEGLEEGVAFTACLLHDIGKLVLDCFFIQHYSQVLKMVQLKEVSLAEAETEMMGFNHADVGGWLCEKWKLPPLLSNPISFHHKVDEVDSKYILISSIVHLADILCKRAQIGNSGDNQIGPIQPTAQENLMLTRDELQKIFVQLKQEESKALDFLSFIQ